MSLGSYLAWFCDAFISCDWQSMNYAIGDGAFINIPLSIALSVHVIAVSSVLWALVDWLVVRRSRASWCAAGYEAGYADGCQSRAVRFAQIRVGKEPDCGSVVLWDPDLDAHGGEYGSNFRRRLADLLHGGGGSPP